MRLIFFLFLAVLALAQAPTPPKSPDVPVKEQYWHAIAVYYQQTGIFQRSLTDQQKKLQDSITKIESEINDLRVKLRAECTAKKMELDETGTDAECKAQVVKPAAGQ